MSLLGVGIAVQAYRQVKSVPPVSARRQAERVSKAAFENDLAAMAKSPLNSPQALPERWILLDLVSAVTGVSLALLTGRVGYAAWVVSGPP